MSSARVYSWASGRTPDDQIEASVDKITWFDVTNNTLSDNLYYRAKGEDYEAPTVHRESEQSV